MTEGGGSWEPRGMKADSSLLSQKTQTLVKVITHIHTLDRPNQLRYGDWSFSCLFKICLYSLNILMRNI